MYVSVIIDVAALALVVLFARLGYKRGLVRTVSELIVVILAMILAGKIADYAAERVAEPVRTAAYAAIEEQVDALVPEDGLAAAPEEIRQKLLEVVSVLPDVLQEPARAAAERQLLAFPADPVESARETLTDLGEAVADRAVNTAVYQTAHVLAYAVAFALVTFLLRLGMRAVFMVMKLPGLRQADQVCGLLVGLGKGLLLMWLAGWILHMVVEIPPEVQEGSFFLRHTAMVTQGPLTAKIFSLPGFGG